MVWGRSLLSCSLGHSPYLPRSRCDSQAQRVARWLSPMPAVRHVDCGRT